MGDSEIGEHNRWSPKCPLLNRSDTRNKSKQPVSDLNKLLSQIRDIRLGAYPETPFYSSNTIRNSAEKIRLNFDFPEYATLDARLTSFDNWPESTGQTPQSLSEAEFFTRKNRIEYYALAVAVV